MKSEGSSNSFTMDRVQGQKESVGGREQSKPQLGNPGSPSLVLFTSAVASCFLSSHWLSLLLCLLSQNQLSSKSLGIYISSVQGTSPDWNKTTLSPDSKFPTLAQLQEGGSQRTDMPGRPSLARGLFQRREIVESLVSNLKTVFPGLLFRSLMVGKDVECVSSRVEFLWGWKLQLGSLACCYFSEDSFRQL